MISKLKSGLSNRQRQAMGKTLKILCRAFWGPDIAFCRELIQGKLLHPLEELEPILNHNMTDILEKIKTFSSRFKDETMLRQQLEEIYIRLFVSTRGKTQTPLYHSCYEEQRPLLMGRPAVEMLKRLEAAELTVSGDIHEPPDHLAVELEFLYFLLKKSRKEADRQAGEFAADFMVPWVNEFTNRLRQNKDSLFYLEAALILSAILNLIAKFKQPQTSNQSHPVQP